MASSSYRPKKPIMSQWPNRPRNKSATKPPFGYAADPNNKEEWVPDEALLTLLEEAFLFLDTGNSLRETAKWLTEEIEIKAEKRERSRSASQSR